MNPRTPPNSGFEVAYQREAERDHQLAVLRERRNWLNARIDAKKSVAWQTDWDERERDALTWALTQLEAE
jgi:hypothetical protein